MVGCGRSIGSVRGIAPGRRSSYLLRTVGAMGGYHAALSFHPGTGYGVVVLMAGHYPDAAKLAYDTFTMLQPAIDKSLADLAEERYAGTWRSVDALPGTKPSLARIVVEKGTLYMEEYVLLGVDVLKQFGAPGRLALRSSMRHDEFRYELASNDGRSLLTGIVELILVYQVTMARSIWDATHTGTGKTYGVYATTPPPTPSTSRARTRTGACMCRPFLSF